VAWTSPRKTCWSIPPFVMTTYSLECHTTFPRYPSVLSHSCCLVSCVSSAHPLTLLPTENEKEQ
jgi:hypothetical protein